MSLFGKKELKALGGLKGQQEVTAEIIAAVNAELNENEITAVEVVSKGGFTELQQRNTQLETQLQELQAQVDQLTDDVNAAKEETQRVSGELADAQESLSAATEELAVFKNAADNSAAGATPPAGNADPNRGDESDDINARINREISEKHNL